jgi:Na+/proline symporter
LATLLGVAAYGIYLTRGPRSLSGYLRGQAPSSWLTIGLSVMATQASAITFLSTPGQGFAGGLSFVQNYFGQPFALLVVAAVFLPLFRRLNVYTAYEYLGQRFDRKTRLLAAGAFLLQRGVGAGLTVYAPAIVLSAVFGWRLDVTILASGLVVIAYTAVGGFDAVSITQKYQMGIIFLGMGAAFAIAAAKVVHQIGSPDAWAVAGAMDRLNAVDFSLDYHRRYTVWSGLIGGFFLSLAYFGTDQSQVQRYIGSGSVASAKLGLIFNAVVKVPMQLLILALGVIIFVFYQFAPAPVVFNETAWRQVPTSAARAIEADYRAARAAERRATEDWLASRRLPSSEPKATDELERAAASAHAQVEKVRARASAELRAAVPHGSSNDADYVFIHFIVDQLPHGLIGLLVAVFFAATLSSKAAELNALGSTTTVDLYRNLIRPDASDAHYVTASKLFTVMWGGIALAFALTFQLAENLIQAVNIVGSLFYGVILGLFLVAFFLPKVRGTAVFWAGILAEGIVLALFFGTNVGYLWFNPIGGLACVGIAALLNAIL